MMSWKRRQSRHLLKPAEKVPVQRELLLTQIIGVLVIALFSFSLTYLIMKILKITIGIRITKEEEKKGIDAVSFGVNSYTSNE